jgi:hypothetical protein
MSAPHSITDIRPCRGQFGYGPEADISKRKSRPWGGFIVGQI